jgi:hypothetical protein
VVVRAGATGRESNKGRPENEPLTAEVELLVGIRVWWMFVG